MSVRERERERERAIDREREREREREKWRDRKKIKLCTLNFTAFFVTLEFLTPILPIKFSINSLCPKFLNLNMHLSLVEM